MQSTRALWFSATLVLLLFLLPVTFTAAASASPCVVFGVNGHPITQSPYYLPSYKDQMSYLTALHSSFYRIDVPLESDLSGRVRLPTSYQNFSQLMATAAATTPPITLLPTIFPTDLPYSNISYDALRNISYLEGQRWTRLYGSLFSVFELSNERDNTCIHNSNGRDPVTGYNQTCLTHLMAQLTGFAAGVKSIAPHLRIIVDVSWVHWGYLDALVSHGMQWDILSPHWYSNMGALNSSYEEIPDVLQYVIERYHKPVWITEINTGDGSMTLPPANQTQWVIDSLHTIRSYPAVQAYMMYELLDEVQWKPSGEAYFGLLQPGQGGVGWEWKEVGTAFGGYAEAYGTGVCKKCGWLADDSSQLTCMDKEEAVMGE